MNEFKILNLSVKDYFTKPMFKILMYPLVASIVVLYTAFFALADMSVESLENSATQIQQETSSSTQNEDNATQDDTITGSGILDFMVKRNLTSWIASFFIYTVGLFAIGYLSIFISLNIIGLLTARILAIIHKKHYPHVEVKEFSGIFYGKYHMLKTITVMIALFIVLIPFYFIPVVNMIAINIPFYYFFHKVLHYDVAFALMGKEEFEKIYKQNKWSMRIRTAILYTISLIPFVAFIISVFYVIYLGHVYFVKLQNR